MHVCRPHDMNIYHIEDDLPCVIKDARIFGDLDLREDSEANKVGASSDLTLII